MKNKILPVVMLTMSNLVFAQSYQGVGADLKTGNSDSTSIDPTLINQINAVKSNYLSNTGNNTAAGTLANPNPILNKVILQCKAYVGQYNIPNPTANQFSVVQDVNPGSASYGQISFPAWVITANGGTAIAPTGCPSSASMPVTQTLACASYVGQYGIPLTYTLGSFTRVVESNQWNVNKNLVLSYNTSGCYAPAPVSVVAGMQAYCSSPGTRGAPGGGSIVGCGRSGSLVLMCINAGGGWVGWPTSNVVRVGWDMGTTYWGLYTSVCL